MLIDSATDHATLAAQLEHNGHDDAAKAMRELLAQVQERDRRIEALEHCIVALGDEVTRVEAAMHWEDVLGLGFDPDESTEGSDQ